MFLVVEGINGSGKSTQAAMLRDYFVKQGKEVIQVREPGGTPIGEQIRVLLRQGTEPLHVNTQVALFLAARAQLTFEVIYPALEQKKIVVADRWETSMFVYQGYALGGMQYSDLEQLSNILLQSLTPDWTFILDLPVVVAIDRRKKMEEVSDRFEKEGEVFQETLRKGYHLMSSYPKHKLVDAEGTPDQVHQRIVKVLESAPIR